MKKLAIFAMLFFVFILYALPAHADEALNNALFDAVEKGDKAKVEALIVKGADVHAKEKYGSTPLHTAASAGRKEVAELLISKGADVNAKNNDGETPLHTAAGYGKKEVAELLISKGADVNAKMNKRYGEKTPLYTAANKEVAELLISKGADVNAKDNDGTTPLHTVAYYGRKEVAELLISKGADVNAKKNNDGLTPLHEAAYVGKKEVAESLISKGADVNAKDNNGATPLHMAARKGNKEVAELLIAKGADVNARKNKEYGEKTPLQVTEGISDIEVRQEIIALLQGQMAKLLNPRQLLNSLLEQFKGHSDNDELRKSIIQAALKLQPPPAIPQEAEDFVGRASYIFNSAQSEDDMLATAKEYLKAVEVAPWVANYYYDLCTVLEKTPYTQQALHACKLYLEAAPNAEDSSAMRQRIAGLKFAVEKNNEQIKQRTSYFGRQGHKELYRDGGISGQVAGKEVALKLVVNWQASPPKYQIFSSCFEGDQVLGGPDDLVSTDTWFNVCGTGFHLIVKPEGAGFVELGGGGSLRVTLDELFQRKQQALAQSPIFKDYGYGDDKGMRFYVGYLHGGRDNNHAGYAMYESDCNGNLLRKDPRALPDDFVSQETIKKEGGLGRFNALMDYKGTPRSGCNDKFSYKTGYKFGEKD